MNTEIDRESYNYFLQEAQDLLKDIEQELLSFKEDPSTVRVHTLMRSAHTLKGATASVGLEVIKEISHVLEDAFKALYSPDVVVDEQIESLLFQGYECLRLPLMAHFNGGTVDESSMLDRAAGVIGQLQEKLGDKFDTDPPLPSSEDLGFDVVKSIFETGVEEKLTQIETASGTEELASVLYQKVEVFLGLGESLNLPGYSAIAAATLKALENYPDEVELVAQVALANFREAQQEVLAGDRSLGGEPSEELIALAQGEMAAEAIAPEPSETKLLEVSSESEVTGLSELEVFESEAVRAEIPEVKISDGETTPMSLDSLLANTEIESDSIEVNPEASKVEISDSETTPMSLDFLLAGTEIESIESDSKEIVEVEAPTAIAEEQVSQTLNLDDLFSQAVIDDIPTEVQNTISDQDFVQDLAVADSVVNTIENSTDELEALMDATTVTTTNVTELKSFASFSKTTPRSIDKPKNRVNTSKNEPKPNQKSTTVRVGLEQLERLNHLAGELLIEQNQQTNQDKQLKVIIQSLLTQLQQHKQTLNELRDWSDRKWLNTKVFAGENTISSGLSFEQMFDPLEMDRYNSLQLLIQKAADEAIQLENLTDLVSLSNKQSSLSREAQQRLLTNVRDDLTNARMQPLGDLFNRFPRVVRQLVGVQKKPAELVLKGTEVLIDKAIVEKLYDPLLHLIRNAYDHGIDLPEDRLRHGKPETGSIEIRAYNQGNRTIIEVQDDGQGIDPQKVAAKAIESGLITPAQAQSATTEELLDLLFESGFSTANAVTDLSGRGVGLDVVRSQLQSLNGSVKVQTTLGRGTRFTLEIPLSLTITELLVCQAKDVVYAIPVNTVEQILIPNTEQLKILGRNHPKLTELTEGGLEDQVLAQRLAQQPVLQWQQGGEDVLVPLYKLGELTQYSAISSRFLPYASSSTLVATEGLLANHQPVILLRTANGLIGLQVEQLLGEKELVIRTLGSAVMPPAYVYGSCILSNSDLALVLDIEKLIEHQPTSVRNISHKLRGQTIGSLALAESIVEASDRIIDVTATKTSKGSLLLVVDDSLTLRQTLSKALSKFGYQVVQAENGQDALDKLKEHQNIDLVVCDVEMPHLNGFEFLNTVNQDRSFQKTPVVMLTSRSADKYRKIAQELGASAYLTKPFIEQELLSTIDSLLTVV